MRKVIGIHSCQEVIRVHPHWVSEIVLKKGFESSKELQGFANFAKSKGLPLQVKASQVLDKVSPSHQGVCLTVKSEPELDFQSLARTSGPQILVALDEVSDPHNVGAVLRSAWLMGVRAILATQKRSAHLTPTVAKVACGGAEHVPFLLANNLASDIQDYKAQGFWAVGLSGESSKSIFDLEVPEKVLWVLGSEERGLRAPVARACDELVGIPQVSSGASYNASVAVSMALFESRRQHEKSRKSRG